MPTVSVYELPDAMVDKVVPCRICRWSLRFDAGDSLLQHRTEAVSRANLGGLWDGGTKHVGVVECPKCGKPTDFEVLELGEYLR